ncbi:MAG: pilO, partial [Deltaproteobacteria bacterium]|nr:pilO [Deltaproteobacteria bacterium]
MKALSEQFRNLNTRDPGGWPPLPKVVLLAVVFAAILVAAYFLDWQGQLEELDAGRAQEAKLKDEYVAKKAQAVNLDM